MTTIAYKDGIIAYDSRLTNADCIITDNYIKRHSLGGFEFFIAAVVPDQLEFMRSYVDGTKLDFLLEVSAFVVEGADVFQAFVSERNGIIRIEKQPMEGQIADAIGSGWRFAKAFMSIGMSAAEAVEATKKLDCNTGGLVRTYKIGQLDEFSK